MKYFSIAYNDRLIDFRELKKLVPYSRTQIWRLEKANRFPKRIQLGPCRVAWLESDIFAWIECRKRGQVWDGANASRQDAHA